MEGCVWICQMKIAAVLWLFYLDLALAQSKTLLHEGLDIFQMSGPKWLEEENAKVSE